MPVKVLRGRKDFSQLNYTEVAGDVKPAKAEDSINPVTGDPVVYNAVWNADESTAQEVTLDTENRTLLEVYVRATTATNVYMDVSQDGTNWITEAQSWSGTTSLNEGFFNASRFVKIRTDAAGTSGTDTITIVVVAK